MIRLKTLLNEITFGNSVPYENTFEWTKYQESVRTTFDDDSGNVIDVVFDEQAPSDDLAESSSYELSFWVNDSYNAQPNITGETNYIRIMATIAAAIYSFITYAQYPDMIEFSGSDSDPKKAEQKTRLYKMFAISNKAKLANMGYRFISNHMGTGIERFN